MRRSLLILIGLLPILILGSAVAASKSGTGFIGVVPAELTSDIAADYGLKGPGDGILIEDVSPGSPAAEAGLRVNDVIVKLNTAKITGPAEFRTQIQKYKPADVVELTYLRGGKSRTVKITLGEREKPAFEWKAFGKDKSPKSYHMEFEGKPFEWHGDSDAGGAFAGIVTQTLNEGLSGYFKVKSGALISEVIKDSPAQKAGLNSGDVIIRIGEQAIESSADVSKAIRSRKAGDVVDFTIVRDGQEQTVKLTLSDRAGQRDLGSGYFGFDADELHRIEVPEIDVDGIRIDVKRQLRDLEDELENLEIEIDGDGNLRRQIRVKMSDAQTISATDFIKANLLELRDKLFELLPVLQAKLENLKFELKRIEQQLQRRSA